MSEQTSSRFRQALQQELKQWQAEGLISTIQAETLSTRYPFLSQGNRSITIALILGSVLLGLGVLLFVGSNWEHMSRLLKVAIIVASIVASYVAGWRFKFEPGNRPKLGSALLLLGSLLYGGGIWLVSQIFNFDTSLGNGMLLWTVGTSAVAFVTKSRLVTVLSAILIPAWNCTQYGPTPGHAYTEIGNALPFVPSMVAGAMLCARSRSRAAMYVLLTGGVIWSAVLSGCTWAGLLAYGSLLFVAYLAMRHKWESFACPILYVGAASGLAAGLVATFDKTTSSDFIVSFTNFAVILGITFLGSLAAGFDKKENYSELVGCLGFSIGGALIAQFAADTPRLLASNLLLVSMIGSLVAAGMKLHKPALVNLAIVFAVLDIICRYFDMFFSMMDRSLFFMIGGLILILAGSYAEKNRRKLMGSFN